MPNYVNILLANTAVSFCHYESPYLGKTEWISIELLRNIIDYCKENNYSINYIYPIDGTPTDIQTLINTNSSICISPYQLSTEATAIVLNSSEIEKMDYIKKMHDKILILRIHKREIEKIHNLMGKIVNNYKKLSLILLDIDKYSEQDISNYRKELEKTETLFFEQYKNVSESLPENNFISDLWLLNEMNNCNAGVAHYTFAPNGKFYICPAFYHNNLESIGDLTKIEIANNYLLTLEHSPLCNQCDIYHCKRCIYLNHLLTGEYNTPSYQQCQIAHIEREFSRNLLERLVVVNKLFSQIPPIGKIEYNDPIEKVFNIGRYTIRSIS